MKFRTDYSLARGFLGTAILLSIAIVKGSLLTDAGLPDSRSIDIGPVLFFGPFVFILLLAAFLKTKTLAIIKGRLFIYYLLNFFPREYDLSLVKQVKVDEWKPPGRVSGFYSMITFNFTKYRVIKTIKVYFADGNSLKIDGMIIEPSDYVELIKKLKKKG